MEPEKTQQQVKPKIWKMLLISWLFVYPTVNLMFFLIFPLLTELPQLVKTLVFTIILVPLMGVTIPRLHKYFWNWIIK
jgi:antibiotic biosynthesis monooxygenase (ABM) superfamily enzyme